MIKAIKKTTINKTTFKQLVYLPFIFIILIAIPLFQGCSEKNENTNNNENKLNKQIVVFTSILPLEYFVQRIGGDRVETRVLVGPGKSPATYEPTPHQAIELGEARILFTVGVPFEKSFIPIIEKNLPNLTIVDTSAGILKRHLESHNHSDEKHDEDSGAEDPHIWLDPLLAQVQAKHILNALIKTDPDNEMIYTENYNLLIKELEILDNEIRSQMEPFKGKTFFVFHPSYGYFADAYNLKQSAIESGGKDPSLAQIEEIVEHAQEVEAKVIFTQPEFSRAAADSIASAIKGRTVILNPLHSDYINNLKNIAREVEKALKENENN